MNNLYGEKTFVVQGKIDFNKWYTKESLQNNETVIGIAFDYSNPNNFNILLEDAIQKLSIIQDSKTTLSKYKTINKKGLTLEQQKKIIRNYFEDIWLESLWNYKKEDIAQINIPWTWKIIKIWTTIDFDTKNNNILTTTWFKEFLRFIFTDPESQIFFKKQQLIQKQQKKIRHN